MHESNNLTYNILISFGSLHNQGTTPKCIQCLATPVLFGTIVVMGYSKKYYI